MKYSSLILLVLLSFWAGCKHEPFLPSDIGVVTPLPPVIIPCADDSIFFQQQILPLFQSRCAIPECHDAETAEEDIILTSYAGIIDAELDEIMEVITENDPDDIMPPPPYDALSSEQIALIQLWIDQGAPDNSCDQIICDTTNVTFTVSVWPIIQNKCTGCHSGSSPQGDLSLTNYEEVNFIVEQNYLLEVITGMDGFTAMPPNNNNLPQCEIDMIELWIENGSPND